MVSLDFPTYITEEPPPHLRKGVLEFEFLQRAGFNIIWARQLSALRLINCPEIPLFLAIQCHTLSQVDTFNKLTEGIKYDGISIPSVRKSPWKLAPFLIKFHQAGVKKIHLLGTIKMSCLALAAYMAHHYFDWVSLDAQSWRIPADSYQFVNPFNLSIISVKSDAPAVDKEFSVYPWSSRGAS